MMRQSTSLQWERLDRLQEGARGSRSSRNKASVCRTRFLRGAAAEALADQLQEFPSDDFVDQSDRDCRGGVSQVTEG